VPRNRSPASLAKARSARKDPSVAEKIIWERLRDSRLGFKFRREHPIGGYRLDFFCREALLAVELDGEQHDPLRDAKRDEELAKHGIVTFRIPNRRFFELEKGAYEDFVLEIQKLCEARTGRDGYL